MTINKFKNLLLELSNLKTSLENFFIETQKKHKLSINLYQLHNNEFTCFKTNSSLPAQILNTMNKDSQHLHFQEKQWLLFPIENEHFIKTKIIILEEIPSKKSILYFEKEILPIIKIYIKNEEIINSKKEIESLTKEKEIFLQKINHELRTPLNSIKGNSHILFDSSLSFEQKQSVLSITQGSEELLSIINNLLEYKNSLNNCIVNINTIFIPDFIDSLKIQFQEKLKEKNIKIEFNTKTKDAFILSDKTKLETIYCNLIDNAIKYSKPNSKIIIDLDFSDSILVFTIKDSGMGFPQETKKFFFNAFSQGDNSSTKMHRGLGLGLPLCQNLICALNGELNILFTEQNVGSIIQVKIKAEKPINDFKLVKKAFKGKMLIVEDDIVNQMILKKNLEMLGFNIDIANNGQEAVEICKKNDYLNIFMDCQMPIMDGYEATKIIKQNKPNQNIIAFTAHSFIEDKIKCLNSGMDDFMTKPINLEILIQKITEHSGLAFKPMQESMLENLIDPQFGEPKELLDFVKSLIAQFTKTTEHDKKQLKKLLQNEEWEQMNRIFHRMKSSFGQFGLVNSKELFAIWQKKESFSNKDIDLFNLHFDVAKICLEEWISKKENSNEAA